MPRVLSAIGVRVTVVIVPGAMAVERASPAQKRRNHRRARNASNKANRRKQKNRLKPPPRVTDRSATSAHAAAEGAVIEAIVRSAKRNPRAKPNQH